MIFLILPFEYLPSVYIKTVESIFRMLWLATQTHNIQCYLPPSNVKLT